MVSRREYPSLVRQSELKAIPRKDSGIPSWTTDEQADTGPHSLISRMSNHTHVTFMFLDPVSMTSMTVGVNHLSFVIYMGMDYVKFT